MFRTGYLFCIKIIKSRQVNTILHYKMLLLNNNTFANIILFLQFIAIFSL